MEYNASWGGKTTEVAGDLISRLAEYNPSWRSKMAEVDGPLISRRAEPALNLWNFRLQATSFLVFPAAVSFYSSGSLGWSLVAKPPEGLAKHKKAKKIEKWHWGDWLALWPPLTNSIWPKSAALLFKVRAGCITNYS